MRQVGAITLRRGSRLFGPNGSRSAGKAGPTENRRSQDGASAPSEPNAPEGPVGEVSCREEDARRGGVFAGASIERTGALRQVPLGSYERTPRGRLAIEDW